MRLYHFTSVHHLPLIEQDGYLRVTDPNLLKRGPSPFTPDVPYEGRGVVWLLDESETQPDANGLKAAGPYAVDKSAVRFTVEVEGARRWLDWLTAQRHDPDWVRGIVRTGGGPSRAKHWYVIPRAIPREEWLSVDVRG